MYIYGRLLIEKSGKLHNPYKGIEIIISASDKGNETALNYAFEYCIKKDKSKIKELSGIAVRSKLYPIKFLDTIITYANEMTDFEDLKGWIDGYLFQMADKDVEQLQIRFKIYHMKLSLYKSEGIEFPENYLESIKKDIDTNQQAISISGCIQYIKDYLNCIYPNYNPFSIWDGDFLNDHDFFLFYSINKPVLNIDILTKNNYEAEVYKIIENNISLDSIIKTMDSSNSDNDEDSCDATMTYSFRKAYGNILQAYRGLVDNYKAIQVEENIEMNVTLFIPYCPSETVLHHCKLALKMLIASQKTYGTNWQDIVAHLDNLEKLLDIAEITEDENAQLLLIEYVETIFDGNEILKRNNELRTAYKTQNKNFICKVLNEYTKKLDKQRIEHKLPFFTEENLDEYLFSKSKSDDDFETLLNDFLHPQDN